MNIYASENKSVSLIKIFFFFPPIFICQNVTQLIKIRPIGSPFSKYLSVGYSYAQPSTLIHQKPHVLL
jgi:hypothetical protein